MTVVSAVRREASGTHPAPSSTERYAAELARVEEQLPGAEIDWLRGTRRAAVARLCELGFPTTRDEDWKYTSLAPIENRGFQWAPQPREDLAELELAPLRLKGVRCHELVFINGHYSARCSHIDALPAGVVLKSLSAMLSGRPDLLREPLQRYTGSAAQAMVALNGALMSDGAYIGLRDGAVIEDPVHLLFVAFPGAVPMACYPRIHIQADAHSRVTVIESYYGLGSGQSLTNALTEIIAGEHARVEHCKLQIESLGAYHIGNLFVRQGPDSQVLSHSIALGAALARNDIAVSLEGAGAAVALNGLYMARGRQHTDHHTRIEHFEPHTRSEEFYKGVLDGYAGGVFNGKVVVHENAQKTDAQQSNRNLLLSANAEVDTKPELQIYADDVKCSHGATVGQLDEDALFYLRSRGVDQETARELLIYAFAEEIVAQIGIEPIRTRLEQTIVGQLPDPERIRALV